MIEIRRSELQKAIEVGISRTWNLTDSERERLREFGRTTTKVGTNFNLGRDAIGCPAGATRLFRTAAKAAARQKAVSFAYAYDMALPKRLWNWTAWPGFEIPVIED